MIRLAIETATSTCSIALETPQESLVRAESNQRIHSKVLLPWINELLSEAGLGFEDLDCLVVGTGPGGFTSLRVGLAVAQGIATAHQLPIYPVSSLLNTAAGCEANQSVLVVMDARLGQVYTQGFQVDASRSWQAVNEAKAIPPERLAWPGERADWAAVGDGLEVYQTALPARLQSQAVAWRPEMGPTAERALALTGEPVKPWGLHAEYVRNSVTS